MQSEFFAALQQVASDKGISPEIVLESINIALLAAYRKATGDIVEEGLEAKVDEQTGEATILKDGENVTPEDFGRIAAQTAKQVILQKLREAEKESLMSEYSTKVGQITRGHVFRVEKGVVVLDLGKAHGIMPPSEQIPEEHYIVNQKMSVLIKEVREGMRGAEVIVSRSDPEFVREMFMLEVPELASGTVEIKNLVREAGSRTKMAVRSTEENIDPVGSCVGQKGVRVRSIIEDLGNERIDIIEYSEDPTKFITNSLSPAKIDKVALNEETKEAVVYVADDQMSLAIGKGGQNVRLGAKLTGWRIDVHSTSDRAKEVLGVKEGTALSGDTPAEETNELVSAGLSARTVKALEKADVTTISALKEKSLEELGEMKGVGKKALEEIKNVVEKV